MYKRVVGSSFLLVAIFVLLPPGAMAETSVWKVEKAGKQMYIGGTFHLLSYKDYPLPDAFEKAYQEASIIGFEADVSSMKSPEFQKQAINSITYNDGRALSSLLSENTYQRLSQYLGEKGISIDDINQMNVGVLSANMTMLELKNLGLVTAAGVDSFYLNKAKQDQKQTVFLESISKQLSFISNMSEGIEDQVITYTLDDMVGLSDSMEKMVASWRAGDMQELDSFVLEDMRTRFPSLYQSFIVERNQNWLPKIETLMGTDEVELLLVGAAHLAGEDGLIQQLESKGYQLEQL